MPDVIVTRPLLADVPESKMIRPESGQTLKDVRRARLRAKGYRVDPPEPVRHRCEVEQIDGFRSCWLEAHVRRYYNLALPLLRLCPGHAEALDDALIGDLEYLATNRELGYLPAQNGPEAVETPKPAPVSAPLPEPTPAAPRGYTRAEMEAARREAVAESRARRRADREARGIPTSNVEHTKSRWGRTAEYRRIEKRRERARKRGLDPDALGPRYWLPRRDNAKLEAAYLVMERAGRRAGLNGADTDDQDD